MLLMKRKQKRCKEDLKKNPALEENGLSEGDEVQLDEEGNVLIKS